MIPLKEIKKRTRLNMVFGSGKVFDISPLQLFDYLYEYNYNNTKTHIKISELEYVTRVTFKYRDGDKNLSISFVLSFKEKSTTFIMTTNFDQRELKRFFSKVLRTNKFSFEPKNYTYLVDLSDYVGDPNFEKAKEFCEKNNIDYKIIDTRPQVIIIKFEGWGYVVYRKGKIICHKNKETKLEKVLKTLQWVIDNIY